MNAVDILRNVENYFDRNHKFYMMWGTLFTIVFFGLYVPFSIHSRVLSNLDSERKVNTFLLAEINDMNGRMEFLELAYERKQAVMREVECLAKNIYFEAGSEPYAGKLAVAQVTMNRVKSRNFPRSVCGVVYQKNNGICQFSWVCQGKSSPGNNRSWREALKIAENVIINKRSFNVVGQAKYFHATYVDPSWSQSKQAVIQIGNHIFYH